MVNARLSIVLSMNPRRHYDPDAERSGLIRFGEEIAQHFAQPLTEVRHARYFHHDGRRWTITTRWERLVDGVWVEEKWQSGSTQTGSWGRKAR